MTFPASCKGYILIKTIIEQPYIHTLDICECLWHCVKQGKLEIRPLSFLSIVFFLFMLGQICPSKINKKPDSSDKHRSCVNYQMNILSSLIHQKVWRWRWLPTQRRSLTAPVVAVRVARQLAETPVVFNTSAFVWITQMRLRLLKALEADSVTCEQKN